MLDMMVRWFQSAPPARGATEVWELWDAKSKFQSAPPARGATAYT